MSYAGRVREAELRDPVPSELLVPFAKDTAGAWLRPGEAADGGRFFCPDCSERVIVREGDEIVRHFAHFRPDGSCRLSGESAEHVAAKLCVVAAVARWRTGQAEAPRIVACCGTCGEVTASSPLKPTVAGAVLERELELDGRRWRLDVALLDDDGRILLGIEVRHRHAVPDEKAARLPRGRLPFLELASHQVLAAAGERLVALRSGGAKLPRECAPCRRAREEAERRAWAVEQARALAAPRGHFEQSLARQASWTARQREALGRSFPGARLVRLLGMLEIAYPTAALLQGFSSRLALHGSLSPAQTANCVWIAQRGPGRILLGAQARPTPAPPPDRQPALFDSV
ncbi:MAG: competence protein CoiA family protein [Planctomycetaceae bacterium]